MSVEFNNVSSVEAGVRGFRESAGLKNGLEGFGSFQDVLNSVRGATNTAKDADEWNDPVRFQSRILSMGGHMSDVNSISLAADRILSADQPLEAYADSAPSFNGQPLLPPLEGFDMKVEAYRLETVRWEVYNDPEVERRAEKLVGMMVGIFGLKVTPEQKEGMKAKLMELAVGVRLQEQWAKAYPMALQEKVFDLSLYSVKDYLISEGNEINRVPRNQQKDLSKEGEFVFEMADFFGAKNLYLR